MTKLVTYKCDRCGKVVHEQVHRRENNAIVLGNIRYDLCIHCHNILSVVVNHKYYKKVNKAIAKLKLSIYVPT